MHPVAPKNLGSPRVKAIHSLRTRPFARVRGLTLVELMIALTILAIGTLALLAAMGQSLPLSTQSNEIEIADTDAQQILEAILGTAWNQMDIDFPHSSPPGGTPLTITSGGDRGVDIDGDGALDAENDLIYQLLNEDMWAEYEPSDPDGSGPTGDEGKIENPVQITVTVRWETLNQQDLFLTRSVVTIRDK